MKYCCRVRLIETFEVDNDVADFQIEWNRICKKYWIEETETSDCFIFVCIFNRFLLVKCQRKKGKNILRIMTQGKNESSEGHLLNEVDRSYSKSIDKNPILETQFIPSWDFSLLFVSSCLFLFSWLFSKPRILQIFLYPAPLRYFPFFSPRPVSLLPPPSAGTFGPQLSACLMDLLCG